jgi:Animal haem peroxidase
MHSSSASATHSAETGCEGCLAPYRVDAPIDAVGRYGRMFDLPALIADEDVLRRIGASGGYCDAGTGNAPDSGPDSYAGAGASSARPQDSRIEAGWPFFGQYVAHDLTADRSPLTLHAEVELLANLRSARADLEPLYGPGPVGAPYLYSRNDPAKLLESDGDLPRNQEGTALAFDPRNDSHIFVNQIQVALIRAHNRLVDRLRADGADEHSLFQQAQRALTWHYQWVIIKEFLPQLAGSELVNTILASGPRFYRPEGTPYIPVEFADGAYRYGHSQVRETYVLRPGREAVRFFPDLLGFGPIGDRTVDWALFFDVPGYPLAQRAKPIDGRLVRSLIRLPEAISGEVSHAAYSSLAARDLQRGHGLGLPSGESVASLIGAEVLSEDELGLSGDDWTGHTPLWIYVQREAACRHSGNRLGEVGGTIIAEVLIGVISNDPESYLSLAPDWQPTLPAHEGDFKLRDLLIEAA